MNKSRKEIHPHATSSIESIGKETWQKMSQIIPELINGYDQLKAIRPAVSIFGSARTQPDHADYKLAETIGEQLSNAGFTVITGGGPGVMEAGNRGASRGKSASVGLNISLPHEQHHNDSQDISINFDYFFTRKATFVRHSMAYVVMPGGFGTIDELFDVLTLMQTDKKKPMPIFLANSAYWSGLLDWIKNTMLDEGMISETDLDFIQVIDSADEVTQKLKLHLKDSVHSDFEF
jgi:uncharacterized protein (TIGR00730 family)